MLSINNNKFSFYKAKTPADFTQLLSIGGEQYCRYLWSKHINPKKDKSKPSAWQALGYRQSNKPVTSLLAFKLASEGYVKALNDKKCSLDVFLSPNQFFDWRNTKQLAQLHANWIDIDTIDHDVISEAKQQEIFNDVLNIVESNGLPKPTAYVASGSGGMHLYWIYEGTEAFKWKVRIWREITLRIAKSIKASQTKKSLWKVDFGASRDPSRVLRLPGTYHGTSGRIAQAYLGGPIYDFNALAKLLCQCPKNLSALERGQLSQVDNIPTLPIKPKKLSVTTCKTGKHTIGQWWFRIYSVICSHARKHGVKVGKRDFYAYILTVALRHIKKSKDEAYEHIKQLNLEFIGLDEDELNAYTKSALTKHYKYSKNTIAEYLESILGISSNFLYENTKTPLTKPQIKQRQKEGAIQTANTRRKTTLEALKDAVRRLAETRLNVTQKSIAALTNRSIRTVRRYWAELNVFRRTIALSVYIPALSDMSPCT